MYDFYSKFKVFLDGVFEIVNKDKSHVYGNFRKVELKFGKRYAKVVVNDSAFCFVDKTNGDVLKAASFNSPAKGARGNIYDASNGLGRVGPLGIDTKSYSNLIG